MRLAHQTRRGPPAYNPTASERLLVERLVEEDVSLEVIRRHVNAPHGLSLNTLKKRFDVDIEVGRARLLAATITNLVQAAADPNNRKGTAAAIELIKRYGARS